jgi:hypothetical protein
MKVVSRERHCSIDPVRTIAPATAIAHNSSTQVK